jgi:hypothetical protein
MQINYLIIQDFISSSDMSGREKIVIQWVGTLLFRVLEFDIFIALYLTAVSLPTIVILSVKREFAVFPGLIV